MIVMGFSKATDYLGYLRSKTGLRIDFNYFFFFLFFGTIISETQHPNGCHENL